MDFLWFALNGFMLLAFWLFSNLSIIRSSYYRAFPETGLYGERIMAIKTNTSLH